MLASDELVELCVHLRVEVLLLLLLRTHGFALLVHRGLLEFLQVLRLKNSVYHQVSDRKFYRVASVKPFLDQLWVFDLFLVVRPEVFLFVATEVWNSGV